MLKGLETMKLLSFELLLDKKKNPTAWKTESYLGLGSRV